MTTRHVVAPRLRRPHLPSVFGVAAAMALGCSRGGSEDQQKLKEYILETPPDTLNRIDANLDNKVHLIGYRFDPQTAKAGQEVKLTYYWRCDDSVGPGWLLFTHIKDDHYGKMDNLDFAGPLREQRDNYSRQLYGPERWEKGKYYVDEQTWKVADWVSGSETVIVGIWKGDERLHVISGRSDGKNGAIVGKILNGGP